MTKKPKPPSARTRAHIDRAERAFIPPERMREVRWEESVAHSKAKRAGITEYKLMHHDCHCGSIGCLCVPILMRWDAKDERWVPANLEDSPATR